ncbi:hypothetical protein [Aquimonas voraii]|uniref:hypothetical protein n=1 Tax=Aquimonas voraii TaxID=265719 RepID=UPI000B885555|nr:hypothetical protein [Aquimonas voraii]
MKISTLSHQTLHRQGSSTNGCIVADRYSADFLVDGQSLLQTLVNIDGGHADFMGCFVKGCHEQNNQTAAALLVEGQPKTASGRVLLYICPECGDIGCGAYAARISEGPFGYMWESFAYENGYEEPRIIEGFGPLLFERGAYGSAIRQAAAL